MCRIVELKLLLVSLLCFVGSSLKLSSIMNQNKSNFHNGRNIHAHYFSQKSLKILSYSSLCLRGGSLAVEEDSESSRLVTKLRNLIRSILVIGEKKSPLATKILKLFVGLVENITGIPLLPSKAHKTKSGTASKKGKKGKHHKTSEDLERKQGKSTTIKHNTKHRAKNDDITIVKTVPTNKSSKAHSHLAMELKTSNANYRIQRELKEFLSSPPPNLSVKVGKNIRLWIITMTGAKNTIFEGETYRLRVQFPPEYPTVPPSVYFLHPTPRHEHVYTNGDICLSLLGKDWRPTMTAQSIAMSILSILSGAQRKSLPMDNARHAQNKPGQRQDNWVYHDDNC